VHLYDGGVGGYDSEWLIISFRENEYADIREWVTVAMRLSGFPIIWSNSKTKPELESWEYMGQIPTLAARMNVDEAYGYMGVVNYKALAPRSTLGRMCVLL
jgi:hypothetical protein